MPQTFEELVGRELDLLYRGALFLTGGGEAAAEDLLVDTLRGAFHTYRSAHVAEGDSQRWLEGCLAQKALILLKGAGPPGTTVSKLYDAAADMPIGPRVAIWLVLMRRWSYAAAADRLQVDREGLRELLKHRQRLVAAIEPLSRSAGNG